MAEAELKEYENLNEYYPSMGEIPHPLEPQAKSRAFTRTRLKLVHGSICCYVSTPSSEEPQELANRLSDWSSGDRDSMTQKSLHENEEKQVREIILKLRRSNSIEHNNKMADRISTLFKLSKEDDPLLAGISITSLQNFYNFLQMYPNCKVPKIALTSDLYIYASWAKSKEQYIDILFLEGREIRLVASRPNEKHFGKYIMSSSSATNDMIIDIADQLHVKDLILE